MKTEIHPTYHTDAVISCACGKTYSIGSTKQLMEVEICAACHPFYTGKEKLIDTAGRVDKFKKRLAKVATSAKTKKTGGKKARK